MKNGSKMLEVLPYARCPRDFTSNVMERCNIESPSPAPADLGEIQPFARHAYIRSYLLAVLLLVVMGLATPASDRHQGFACMVENGAALGGEIGRQVTQGIIIYGRSAE